MGTDSLYPFLVLLRPAARSIVDTAGVIVSTATPSTSYTYNHIRMLNHLHMDKVGSSWLVWKGRYAGSGQYNPPASVVQFESIPAITGRVWINETNVAHYVTRQATCRQHSLRRIHSASFHNNGTAI